MRGLGNNMGHYSPKMEYFNSENFPFKKAILVTAQALVGYCEGYKFGGFTSNKKLIMPESKGKFPLTLPEKQKKIKEIIDWLLEDKPGYEQFLLFMYRKYRKYWFFTFLLNEDVIFNHHDDTCCWVLILTEEEFSKLKKEWKKNNLPEDLFYPVKKVAKRDTVHMFDVLFNQMV